MTRQPHHACTINSIWNTEVVNLLTSVRMRRKIGKGFHNMASRNVSNAFTAAGISVRMRKGNILKGM